MAASAIQNPPAQADSKSAKKKKAAKAAERTESPAPSASPAPEKTVEGQDDANESPYVRELQKNIRNMTKRLTNASKTDSLIAEHKDKTLDDLVAAKIINADQKAQHLKKPALQAQLTQLEDQLKQYLKVESEFKSKLAAEKAEVEKKLTETLAREKEEAVKAAQDDAASAAQSSLRASLLLVSQFLQLAAARRAEDADQSVDENQALEGVLLTVYGGDDRAVETMLKLVEGSEEKTHNTALEPLQTTFAQVKSAAQAHEAAYASESQVSETEAQSTTEAPATDPTVAHASLTEIDAGDAVGLTNGHAADSPTKPAGNADVTNGAANEAAENQWDAANDASLSISQEWVDVPRDPAETETGLSATPAAATNTQSWADDQPEAVPEPAAPADPNDGFHQVQGRNRGRGDRERGGWRGRGRGGEWRGRGGYRGEGRGRGRGGPRRGDSDGNVPVRGPRRTEES